MIRSTPLRRRALPLGIVFALFLANLAWLVSFQVLYVRRAEARTKKIDENAKSIQALQAELRERRDELDRIRSLKTDKDELYGEVFDQADRRLTDRIRRLRKLAVAADLRITSLTFVETFANVAPIRIVDFRFGTDGTYAGLKRFLNSLEIDSEFLAVSQLSLLRNDPVSGRPEIAFVIAIRTAFHDPDAATKGKSKSKPAVRGAS